MTPSTTPPSKADEAAAYINDRLGKPWDAQAFHCWTLVQETVRDLFGLDAPFVAASPRGRRAKADLFNGHEARARWQEVERPSFWAVALMHHRGSPRDLLEHAGVFFNMDGGLIFHCDKSAGVVADQAWEMPRVRTWAVPRLFIPGPATGTYRRYGAGPATKRRREVGCGASPVGSAPPAAFERRQALRQPQSTIHRQRPQG